MADCTSGLDPPNAAGVRRGASFVAVGKALAAARHFLRVRSTGLLGLLPAGIASGLVYNESQANDEHR
jgi:hypothetical protein